MEDPPIRILLIENNPDYVVLMREMLANVGEASFSLECADDLSTALERLKKKDVDIVLLDLWLPDSRGLDTFANVHSRAPDVPIIILSALKDRRLAAEAIEAGAQDYLVKEEVDPARLVRAIHDTAGSRKRNRD